MCKQTTSAHAYPRVDRLARVQGDVGGVALDKHAKANLELGLHAVITVEGHDGSLAPGHKLVVVIDVSHDIVELLWRPPGPGEVCCTRGAWQRWCVPDEAALAVLFGQFCIHSRQGQEAASVGGELETGWG